MDSALDPDTVMVSEFEQVLFGELCPFQVGLPDFMDSGARGFCTWEDAPSGFRNLAKVCGNFRIIKDCVTSFGFKYGDRESEIAFLKHLENQCKSRAFYADRLCGGLKQVDYAACSFECEYSDLPEDCARCTRNPVGRLEVPR